MSWHGLDRRTFCADIHTFLSVRMIMDEMDLVSYVDYPNPPHAEWLPIRLSWDVGPDPAAHDGTEEKIRTLRALSQTCKSLQSVVLPFLWQNVQLDTVAELGRLRETLRVSPHLAYHIRSFCFIWNPAFIPNRYFDEDPHATGADVPRSPCTVAERGQQAQS